MHSICAIQPATMNGMHRPVHVQTRIAHSSGSTAYTAVPARRMLASRDPPIASNYTTVTTQQANYVQQPQAKTPGRTQWPDAVREYVRRSFEEQNLIPGIGRPQMEQKLKEVITHAGSHLGYDNVDWASHPLPQQLIQHEQQMHIAAMNVTLTSGQQTANQYAAPPLAAVASPAPGFSPFNGTPGKKRKSTDLEPTEMANGTGNDRIPPWQNANNEKSFEERIKFKHQAAADRMAKRQRKFQQGMEASKSSANLEKRRQRFERGNNGTNSPFPSSRDDTPMSDAPSQGPVIGTCQDLEKGYFRLTSAPKPEAVRPQPVLQKSLALMKKKWKEGTSYAFICDQFKSMRQDLTVQHIKNKFTTEVYEIHARIALEKGDLGEYNQCQTQLRALYKQNLGGHPAEFLAYRILYFIHTCNRSDMNDVLADLTTADKNEPAVKHALEVRSALAMGNYHRFFRLYLNTPNLGGYLMDKFIVRERLAALAVICKVYVVVLSCTFELHANAIDSYKQDVKLRFLTDELGFESDVDCAEFIFSNGAPQELFENRNDVLHFLTAKVGPLFKGAKETAFKVVDIKGQI
jgi:SAC3 family protein LENG8/THP3